MGNSISSTESTLSDSEFDSCDLHDVKFIPNVSTFVLERQENLPKSVLKKASRTKCEHKSVAFEDEYVTCAVETLADKSNTQQHHHCKETSQQQNYFDERYFCSQDEVPMVFNSGRLLPEFPELRDSYDQFCTTTSESSSRDDLDGKSSNRSIGVLSELKSTREMRDSRYSSDETLSAYFESVRACKRRRKTTLEYVRDADEKNHRWSMPEFTKLWHENSCGDSDIFLNGQHHSPVQQDGWQIYIEQSTQTCSTPVLWNTDSNESFLEHQTAEAVTSENTKIEEKKSASKQNGIIRSDSKFCPTVVSVEPSLSLNTHHYDSSGFYDDGDSLTSSPTSSHSSVNTVKEKAHWHVYKPGLKDSGIYANEDADSSALVGEINVDASDSGCSGMSNGAIDSPEGEETNFDVIEDLPVDNLRKAEDFRPVVKLIKKSNSGGNCRYKNDVENYDQGKVRDEDAILKTGALDREKGKRCAQLMKEFIVNRTLDSYTPSSSFYRTSAV